MTNVGQVSFKMVLDTSNLRGEVAKVNAILGRQTVRLKVGLDAGSVRGDLAKLSQALKDRNLGVRIPVTLDARGIRAQIAQISREAQAIKVPVQAAGGGGVTRGASVSGGGAQSAAALARELANAEKAAQRTAEQISRINARQQEKDAAALARELAKAEKAAQRAAEQAQRIVLKNQEREAAAFAKEFDRAAAAAQRAAEQAKRLQEQSSRDKQTIAGANFSSREIKQVESALKNVSKETQKAEQLAALLREKYGLADGEARNLARSLGGVREQQGQFNAALAGFAGAAGFVALNAAIGALQNTIGALISTFQQASQSYREFESNILSFQAKSQGVDVDIESLADEIDRVAKITSQSPASLSAAATQLVSLGVAADEVEGRLDGLAKASDVLSEDPVILGRVFQGAIAAYEKYGVGVEEVSDIVAQAVNTTAIGARSGAVELEQLFSKAAAPAAELGATLEELVTLDALFAGAGARPEARATAVEVLLTRIASQKDKLEQEGVEIAIKENGGLDLEGTLRNIKARLEEIPDTAGRLNLLRNFFGEAAGNDILLAISRLDTAYADLETSIGNSSGAIQRSFDVVSQGTEFQAGVVQGNFEAAFKTLGETLNPIEKGFISLQQAVLGAAQVDLSPLTSSAELLGNALSNNPELVESLSQALSELAQSAINQISSILDSLTALASNPEVINSIEGIGSALASVIDLLGRFAQGVIGAIELAAPLFAEREIFPGVETSIVGLLQPFTLLQVAAQTIGSAFNIAKDALQDFAERFPIVVEAIKAAIPGLGVAATAVGALVDRIPDRFKPGNQPEQQPTPPPEQLGSPLPTPQQQAQTRQPQQPQAQPQFNVRQEGLAADSGRIRANKELTTRLNEIEGQATAERIQLTQQGADQESFAALEQRTLNQRIQARQAFINRIKELQQRPGNSVEENLALESALADAEKDLAADRLSVAQNFQRDRQTILDNIVRDNSRANAELERDNAQAAATLAGQNLSPRDRQAAEARQEQQSIRDRIANRESLLSQLREQEAKGGLSAEQARELQNQILAVETEIFGARAELSRSLESERLRLAEQGYADQLQLLSQFKEQEALRAGQQTTGIQNQQQVLEADTGLVSAQNQLEQARLATALATAQAEAGVATNKRQALAAQREINAIQLEQFDATVEATAQELAAKRQSFELSAKLTRIEAQRAIQAAEIAALEAQIEVQRARTAGATQQEIDGLQAVANLLTAQIDVARDSAAVTDQVLGTKREALTVEEQIAEEQLKQNGILAEGNRLADARRGIISALAAESSATPNEGIENLARIRDRFRDARSAGLFRGENVNGAISQVESALRGGNDRRLFELAQSNNPLITQLIDAAGRSDITGLVAADKELALAKTVQDGNTLIVDRLDTIIEQGGLGARIDQLVVSTPDPVADTSRIVSDVASLSTAGVNV